MNNRRFYPIYALVVIIALFIGFRRFTAKPNVPAPVHWKTANPVLSPKSQPLSMGAAWTGIVHAVTLPKDQLASAEWYLPISGRSSIAYILHDGRARWVVNGVAHTLKNPPDDPADQFSYADNGQILGWSLPSGGATIVDASGIAQSLSHVSAVAFTQAGTPVALVTSAHRVSVRGRSLGWVVPGTPAATHPFVDHANTLIVDRNGLIEAASIPSGTIQQLAQVRDARWPQLLTARSVGQGVAVLLERPAPVPRYLVLWMHGGRVGWYRFASPTTPQLGVVKGNLVVGNADPSGQLVVIAAQAAHPLNVTPGIFSSGPAGIVWQSSKGFEALTGWKS